MTTTSARAKNGSSTSRATGTDVGSWWSTLGAARATAATAIRAVSCRTRRSGVDPVLDTGLPQEISRQLRAIGCDELSLGDTIGVGSPLQTGRILELFLKEFDTSYLALHLHDTNGTALANCLVGLEMGITTFDTSIGGMGGCPYAPGAAGNLATEDLASMLADMAVETGIDLERLFEAGELAQQLIGRKLPGRRLQAALGRRKPGEAREAAST